MVKRGSGKQHISKVSRRGFGKQHISKVSNLWRKLATDKCGKNKKHNEPDQDHRDRYDMLVRNNEMLEHSLKMSKQTLDELKKTRLNNCRSTLEIMSKNPDNLPKFVLLPEDWIQQKKTSGIPQFANVFKTEWRLLFVCEGGKDREKHHLHMDHGGYRLKCNKQWLKKALPFLKVGFQVLSFALRAVSSLNLDFMTKYFEDPTAVVTKASKVLESLAVEIARVDASDTDLETAGEAHYTPQSNTELLKELLEASTDYDKFGPGHGLEQMANNDIGQYVWVCKGHKDGLIGRVDEQDHLDTFASTFFERLLQPTLKASAWPHLYHVNSVARAEVDVSALFSTAIGAKYEINASKSDLTRFDFKNLPKEAHKLWVSRPSNEENIEYNPHHDVSSGGVRLEPEILRVTYSYQNQDGNKTLGKFFAGNDPSRLLDNILRDTFADDRCKIFLPTDAYKPREILCSEADPQSFLPKAIANAQLRMLRSCVFYQAKVKVSDLLANLPSLAELACVHCATIFEEKRVSGVESWYFCAGEGDWALSPNAALDVDNGYGNTEPMAVANDELCTSNYSSTLRGDASNTQLPQNISANSMILSTVPLAVWSRESFSAEDTSRYARLREVSDTDASPRRYWHDEAGYVNALDLYEHKCNFQDGQACSVCDSSTIAGESAIEPPVCDETPTTVHPLEVGTSTIARPSKSNPLRRFKTLCKKKFKKPQRPTIPKWRSKTAASAKPLTAKPNPFSALEAIPSAADATAATPPPTKPNPCSALEATPPGAAAISAKPPPTKPSPYSALATTPPPAVVEKLPEAKSNSEHAAGTAPPQSEVANPYSALVTTPPPAVVAKISEAKSNSEPAVTAKASVPKSVSESTAMVKPPPPVDTKASKVRPSDQEQTVIILSPRLFSTPRYRVVYY